MAWVTFRSPLWHKDTVQSSVHALPDIHQQRNLERGFVNDAIRTFVRSSRRKPIIPAYNAERDKCARAYFRCPLVQSVMDRSLMLQEKQKQDKNEINKLSHRRRAKRTPTVAEIRAREEHFVNDAILTERMRTKYKDIIPVYDASHDKHCGGYFARQDVKRLLRVTCSQGQARDIETPSKKIVVTRKYLTTR
ncbi:hypothetical protein FSP39_001226 [Pinctada imbricata]|uniref:Uncharacterized protein n=1 Tax=Pinctada imbricata TaxID=66713 RepID=A0AA88XCA1_PINIB|nr:hypothetical protein FSP39_001226 [Pinctada imbricata]